MTKDSSLFQNELNVQNALKWIDMNDNVKNVPQGTNMHQNARKMWKKITICKHIWEMYQNMWIV